MGRAPPQAVGLRRVIDEIAADLELMAVAAERAYIQARIALLDRWRIILERRKLAMPNNMQTKGAVARKPKVPKKLKGMGPGKAKREKTRATKQNARRP